MKKKVTGLAGKLRQKDCPFCLLSKTPGFVLTQMKFSGTIFVAYFNNGLYEMLKTSSRQNI